MPEAESPDARFVRKSLSQKIAKEFPDEEGDCKRRKIAGESQEIPGDRRRQKESQQTFERLSNSDLLFFLAKKQNRLYEIGKVYLSETLKRDPIDALDYAIDLITKDASYSLLFKVSESDRPQSPQRSPGPGSGASIMRTHFRSRHAYQDAMMNIGLS